MQNFNNHLGIHGITIYYSKNIEVLPTVFDLPEG